MASKVDAPLLNVHASEATVILNIADALMKSARDDSKVVNAMGVSAITKTAHAFARKFFAKCLLAPVADMSVCSH